MRAGVSGDFVAPQPLRLRGGTQSQELEGDWLESQSPDFLGSEWEKGLSIVSLLFRCLSSEGSCGPGLLERGASWLPADTRP